MYVFLRSPSQLTYPIQGAVCLLLRGHAAGLFEVSSDPHRLGGASQWPPHVVVPPCLSCYTCNSLPSKTYVSPRYITLCSISGPHGPWKDYTNLEHTTSIVVRLSFPTYLMRGNARQPYQRQMGVQLCCASIDGSS